MLGLEKVRKMSAKDLEKVWEFIFEIAWEPHRATLLHTLVSCSSNSQPTQTAAHGCHPVTIGLKWSIFVDTDILTENTPVSETVLVMHLKDNITTLSWMYVWELAVSK